MKAVTTLFFWRFCFSLRTFYKELIWYTKDPDARIRTFCKRWHFLWRCFSTVSVLNVDVSYDGNRSFSELMNKSKPGSKGSNKNAILIFLFLTSSFFRLLIKEKPDVRVKIIPQAIFFFIGSPVKHLQRPTSHHDINVCSRSHFFTTELINKFESLYTSHCNQFFISFTAYVW